MKDLVKKRSELIGFPFELKEEGADDDGPNIQELYVKEKPFGEQVNRNRPFGDAQE